MIRFRRGQQDTIGDYLRTHAGAQVQVTANDEGLIVSAITVEDEYGEYQPALGFGQTVQEALSVLSKELTINR